MGRIPVPLSFARPRRTILYATELGCSRICSIPAPVPELQWIYLWNWDCMSRAPWLAMHRISASYSQSGIRAVPRPSRSHFDSICWLAVLALPQFFDVLALSILYCCHLGSIILYPNVQ